MLKSIISNINSWSDFKNILETKTKLEKGKAFEELTKYYLEYKPIYKTRLKNVWLQKEVPSSVLKKLNLPTNDQGIDLIAETIEGNYWAIQCKYLQDENQRLSHRAISTFVSLSTGIAENITYCLVCSTVDEYAKIYEGKENIGFCNSDEWRKLDKVFFDWLRNKLSGKEKKLIPVKPKSHQVKALKEATNYFVKEKNNRGKLVFPCGAGKSLTGYWITRELKSKSIIVAVPSLALVKQTLEVYLRESVANNDTIAWLCVCSDEGIGKNDDVVIHTNEIGVPCLTNKTVIAKWLSDNSKKKTIIFTTYQSGKTIAEASKIANHSFDLGIMDEAHKTVGQQDKLFSHLLFEKNIKIRKRIFMTATERRYAGSTDTVLSMDDVNVYGETFTQMSFKEAIDLKILSDYRIITLFISNAEVKNLIQKNAFVMPLGKEWDNETEARTLASLIALRKAMTEYPIHHAVTFHSSIKKAEAFEQSQSLFNKAFPKYANVKSYHVSGKMATGERGKIVDEFAETEKGIITNAKCLTEGVDVPNIDCVLFVDPRKSTVDIVQAVGRVLRKKAGKDFGYVILPVFTESNDTDEIIKSEEFQEVLSTLRALASNDERIVEYFRDISKGKKINQKDSFIQFDIDLNIAENINEKELIDTIKLKIWNKLAKLSWMPFDEARDYVRKLNLGGHLEWRNYCISSEKPIDIPSAPYQIYKNSGWINMKDFLGSHDMRSRPNNYLDYEEAKKVIRPMKFKNITDWNNYRRENIDKENIPNNPQIYYKKKGWKGWGDWLGNGNIATQNREYLSFIFARDFSRNLKLSNLDEWYLYCKSGKKPLNIPTNPDKQYKKNGWSGYGDWLGTYTVSNSKKKYFDFFDARNYVQKLNFKSQKDWRNYRISGEKPNEIPSNPESVYKNKGWISFGDWLGTNKVADQYIVYKNFQDARAFAQSLNLKSGAEWKLFCKSGKKPFDIPLNVNRTYAGQGWIGMGDFLGTGNISNSKKKYQDFDKVKLFVKSLNLKNQKDWNKFCNSGKKPTSIPRAVNRVYENIGWKGWADFFGKK